MFKLIFCALFVTAAYGFSDSFRHMLEEFKHSPAFNNIGIDKLNLMKLSKRESIGHQLKEQLKNVAVSSLTGTVSTVLDKALGALTDKAVSGITNLLGHIHLGKRDLSNHKDFLEHEKKLNELYHQHKFTEMLNLVSTDLPGKHKTRDLSNHKDFLEHEKKLNELYHQHKFTEMLNLVSTDLPGKHTTRGVFGDFLKGDIVQNVKDFIQKEKELLNELLHHHQTTRSTGSELKAALKGALVNSATGAINTVVNTAISGLTSALNSGLSNILGHIHLGKRELGFANEIVNFEHLLKSKVNSLIKFEKQHIIDEVLNRHQLARRNIFGDIGKLIGNEFKQIGAGALGSLGQLATDRLSGLISKLGKREAEDLSTIFGGVADKFSTAITDALGELPQIIAQELGPLIAQFSGSQ